MVGITELRKRLASLSVVLIASFFVTFSHAEEGKSSKKVEVRHVVSKKLALSEFHTVDKKALITATEIKVEKVDGKVKSFGANEVASLVRQLKTKLTPSSAGEPEFKVHFINKENETLNRTIWIMHNGEWGVVRPGTSWTTGKSLELREEILKMYKSK